MVLVVLVLSMAPRGGPAEPAREGLACYLLCNHVTVVLAGYWEVSFGTGFVHVPSVPSVDRMRVCAGPAARVQAVRVVQGAARPYNTNSHPSLAAADGEWRGNRYRAKCL